MRKIFKKFKIVRLFLIIIILYFGNKFVDQQSKINLYNSQKEEYEFKIDEAIKYNEELLATKENLNSEEYIKKISREKLDMYSENEKIYVNKTNKSN